MPRPPVRLLEERRFDPPRAVLVQDEGQWWPGMQLSWRLCDDHRGWMAHVTWRQQHDWGLGTANTFVTPDRVRLPDGSVP